MFEQTIVMMMFRSKCLVVGDVGQEFSEEQIKAEPMFYAADQRFVAKNAGPITKAFLENLDWDFEVESTSGVIIDSRVHMLMPGWYPAIPGWHLDDIPRDPISGQPDLENPPYEAEHIAMVVGDSSLTEFVDDYLELHRPPPGWKVYKFWNQQIEGFEKLSYRRVKSGQLVKFGMGDFHRATPAWKSGFRFFIRATRNSLRPIKNERRSQVKVYLRDLTMGW